jgi:DNA (cytosine-5)-methyltransferase 1
LLVDAKHFTPQSRPRLFIIGVLNEVLPPNVAKDFRPRPGTSKKKLYEVIRRTSLPTGWVTFPTPQMPSINNALSALIDTSDELEWWNLEETAKHFNRTSQSHRRQLELLQGTQNKWVGTGFRRVREGATRLEVRFDGIAGCLRTANGGSARQIVILIDKGELKMRWMTPREYARLQGAPDFAINCGVNQALTGFGDGVCVPVIEWLDTHILSQLYEAPHTFVLPKASQQSLPIFEQSYNVCP